ncbi:MAG: hypothetical protein K9I94_11330 [Bacteroidales bacterium]|nr:hypothetical protein [Bacteroidales bacterium]
MGRIMYSIRFLFGICVLAIAVLGCEKQDPIKSVPSFIRVDSLWLTPESGQGTASHNITDAWIYIDDQFLGAYELPLTDVPVLKGGENEIMFLPGIEMNGISNTRVPYPFFEPIRKNVNLIRDSVYVLDETDVEYKQNTVFKWIEDFEGGIPTFDTTIRSNTTIRVTDEAGKKFHYPGESNSYSGVVKLTQDTTFFEIISKDEYELPGEGDYVFLELNFKTDIEFTAGVFANSSFSKEQKAILVINPTDTWKKIYINLTHSVSTSQEAGDFSIYFSGSIPPDLQQAEVLIDNLKLLHL